MVAESQTNIQTNIHTHTHTHTLFTKQLALHRYHHTTLAMIYLNVPWPAMVYLNVPWQAMVYGICTMKFSFNLRWFHDTCVGKHPHN